MVAKITVGTSLYGALAYNGVKVNEGEGKLLAVNKVFADPDAVADPWQVDVVERLPREKEALEVCHNGFSEAKRLRRL